MYVHAYQSYLWNSVTSSRIQLYGVSSPVPGDLVYENPSSTDPPPSTPAREGKITKESVTSSSKLGKVKVLKEEDVEKYTIHDVLLPLPGYAVTYPGGQLGDMYTRMMAADGLDANDMYRAQKCLHSPFSFPSFLIC